MRGLLPALLGVAAFALLCELLFRALPVPSATKMGYYIDPAIPTYAPHHDWRYATGWDLRHPQHLRTNNLGFVSAHEVAPNPAAVGLVGDSYVESASLPAADRPEAQLERAIGGTRPVFAAGVQGTALLDYAERIRLLNQRFGVTDFVVMMERGDVRQVLCDSGNVHHRCLDPQTFAPRTASIAPPSGIKRLLRESALAQYLTSALKIQPVWPWPGLGGSGTAAAPAATAARPAERSVELAERAAAAFFGQLQPLTTRRLVLVLDADRAALRRGSRAVDPARRRFIDLAQRAGAVVVDLEPLFAEHFERSALSLDIGPRDGHLNRLGVELAMNAAAQALRSPPLSKRATP